MVVFDASILLFVFEENVKASVPRAKERVEYLIDTLSKTGEKIIIPTPALSECLVHAGPAGPEYLNIIGKQSCFGSPVSTSGRPWRQPFGPTSAAARAAERRQSGSRQGEDQI